MSFGINVKGGTGAGSKRPLKQKGNPWACTCGYQNKGHWATCPNCNRKRP